MKLKANELRLGNKFECMGMVQTVFELIDNTDRGRIKQSGYEYLITCEENGNQYKPIEIRPIHITEGWLMEFGFRNYDENKWDTDAMTILKYDEGCKYLANHLHVNIFYVHQLQNLYFALTGNELTLKP